MDDWLDLVPVEPLYRAFYPDGSQLDVHSDVDAMADEIERVISPAEAAGYRRYVDFVSKLYRYEMRDFIDTNIDSPARPRHARTSRGSSRSAASASSRPRSASTSTTRAPSGSSASRRCTPASRRRTRSRSTPSSPTWTPSRASTSPRAACTRCPARWPRAAEKHGVRFRYGTEVTSVETRDGRAIAVITADGERIARDVVVLNPDLPVAMRELLGEEPWSVRRLTYSPSCFLLLAGSTATYSQDGAPQHPLRPQLGRRLPRAHRREAADERPVHPRDEPDLLRPVAGARRQADLLRAVPDPEPRRRHRLAHRGPALPRRGRAHARGARLRRVRRRHRGRARHDPARLGGARHGARCAVRRRALLLADRSVPPVEPLGRERRVHRLGHAARRRRPDGAGLRAASRPSGSPVPTRPTGRRTPAEARGASPGQTGTDRTGPGAEFPRAERRASPRCTRLGARSDLRSAGTLGDRDLPRSVRRRPRRAGVRAVLHPALRPPRPRRHGRRRRRILRRRVDPVRQPAGRRPAHPHPAGHRHRASSSRAPR